VIGWCWGGHRRTTVSAEGIKKPHDQFIIFKDCPDDLYVGATVDTLIAWYTTLVNCQVASYRTHGLTTPAWSGQPNQQQGTPQVSLEP